MVERERLAQMVQSGDVRTRGLGVVALWLDDNTDIPDPIAAATELIRAELDAGLVTVILDDLHAHIDAIKAEQ